jgi:hypothetical protein
MAGMDGTIDVPKVGPVKKIYVLGGAGALAAYVIYRYWMATQEVEELGAPVDPAFGEGEVLPVVPGAYTPGGGGIPDGEETVKPPAPPADNAEWSRRAAEELAGMGGMEYSAVVAALGAYLARKPLSTSQASIVQAAIAVMGYPPSGSFAILEPPVIVPGGDTKITVAPGGFKATAIGTTTVDLTWTAVPGATGYRIYRGGVSQNVAASQDLIAQVGGLQPNKSYTFQVAAEGMGESSTGPRSSTITVRTKPVVLKAPTGLKASPSTTSAVLSWTAVPGATYYRIYVNSIPRGAADTPTYKVIGLKSKTTYKIQVAADTTSNVPGPKSAALTVKTK